MEDPDATPAAVGPRVFILSPARLDGERGAMLLRPGASFDLARRLQGDSAPLGEVMSFISGLYFRGKLAYARAFSVAPPESVGALVILARGLASVDQPVTAGQLRREAAQDLDPADPAYRASLCGAARLVDRYLGPDGRAILLGSIATDKYVGPLLEILGPRLLFPASFVGRGDNSRGGLLLRAAAAGAPLDYIPVAGAIRRGPRPPRLPRR